MLHLTYSAQDAPQGVGRKAPEGMPTQVPPRRPVETRPPVGEPLPKQKAISDEPEITPPPKWKAVAKRVLIVLGLLLSLAMVYVFLLMGEPDEDSQLTQQNAVQEESIRVPIAAAQIAGDGDMNPLAVNFGKPVLAINGSNLTLQKATLFDTAFHNGYARRMSLSYAFADGALLTVESIRPTAAAELLKTGRYSINMATLYTIAGMDAVRMDSEETVCILARSLEAVYALLCPASHEAELGALLKQATLMQPATP